MAGAATLSRTVLPTRPTTSFSFAFGITLTRMTMLFLQFEVLKLAKLFRPFLGLANGFNENLFPLPFFQALDRGFRGTAGGSHLAPQILRGFFAFQHLCRP